MADRLELAIVLEDDGQAPGPIPTPSPSPSLRSSPPSPPQPGPQPPASTGQPPTPPANSPAPSSKKKDEDEDNFDPYEQARKRLDARNRSRRVQSAMEEIDPESAKAARAASAQETAGAISNPMGAAAEAVPEIAIAMAIKEQVEKAIKAPFEAVQEGAKGAAEQLNRLAANDNLEMFGTAVNAVADKLENFGLIGMAAGETLKTAMAGITAFSAVVDSFVQRARQLSNYSPDLAASTARSDVTSTLADIREAQELGPDLARLQDAQTELIDTVKEMLLPIKQFTVEVLADIMEAISAWVSNNSVPIEDSTQKIIEILKHLPAAIGYAIKGDFRKTGYEIGTAIADGDKIARDRAARRGADETFDRIVDRQLEAIVRDAFRRPGAPVGADLPGAIP